MIKFKDVSFILNMNNNIDLTKYGAAILDSTPYLLKNNI